MGCLTCSKAVDDQRQLLPGTDLLPHRPFAAATCRLLPRRAATYRHLPPPAASPHPAPRRQQESTSVSRRRRMTGRPAVGRRPFLTPGPYKSLGPINTDAANEESAMATASTEVKRKTAGDGKAAAAGPLSAQE